MFVVFFFSSRRRHTRYIGDWSSDVCSSDLRPQARLTVNVTSNRAWGLQLTSDRSDGRSRQWNGSSYGALGLANPMQWRTSSIGGLAQGTTFADLSGTAATAVHTQAAAAGAVAVGLTFRPQVSYADEAALPAGNTYRQNVSYTAQQGF